MTLAGHGWSTSRITLSWEDGRPLVQVTADAAGDFAVAWTVPITTTVGTYRITANDGQQSAAGQIAVYAPTLARELQQHNGLGAAHGRWLASVSPLRDPLLIARDAVVRHGGAGRHIQSLIHATPGDAAR